MKDSKSIISHLVQQPYMKKFKQVQCYDRLLCLLPKSLTTMIKFLYNKNETLFFVLNNPCAKMEFNYKRNLIKSLLSQIVLHFPECQCLHVKDIQCFVSNQLEEKITPLVNHSMITYNERSDGTFDNRCSDETLHALFEHIREEIQTQIC